MSFRKTLFLDEEPAGGAPGDPPAGGAPPAGEPAQFDRGKLHPALRDMAPEEITELFETMAGTLRTVQSTPRTPAGDGGLLDTSGVPAHARPAPEPVKPISKERYKELLDPSSDTFDPNAAFQEFAQQNYGHLFGEINARSIRGLFGTFRSEFPDFKEFEGDITKALEGRDPATLSEKDVLNTYLTAKGLRQTLKERQERGRAAATTLAPSAPKAGEPADIELSDLEVEIAHKMFRRIKDPAARVAEYKKFAAKDDGGAFQMKVPIGGGKSE